MTDQEAKFGSPQQELQKAEIEARLREYDAIIAHRKSAFIGWTDIPFTIGLGDHFAFHRNTGRLTIPAEELARGKYSGEEVLYIMGHEVGHVVQYEEDQEGYNESFTLPVEVAQTEAEKFLKQHPCSEEAQQLVRNIFVKSARRLQNILYDIADNAIVRSKALAFQEGYPLNQVERDLYDTKLFPRTDYRNELMSVAFSDGLIIKAMLPQRELKVAPEVQRAFDQRFSALGVDKDLRYWLEFLTKRSAQGLTKASHINYVFENLMAPVMFNLLKQDLDELDLEELKEIQQKTQPEVSLLDIPKDVSAEIKKYADEQSKIRKMNPQQWAEYQKARTIRLNLAEMGATEDETESIAAAIESVSQARDALVNIWNKLLDFNTRLLIAEQGAQETGYDLDMEAVVDQWADIIHNPQKAKVMIDEKIKTAESIRPKKIILMLTVDLSGSMNGSKQQLIGAQEMILGSLYQFKRNQELAHQDQPDLPVIETEQVVIYYGTGTDEARLVNDPNQLLATHLHVYRTDMGGTRDYNALKACREKLQEPKLAEQIASGEVIPLVLQLTDGDTHTVTQSAEEVKLLMNVPNIIMGAWQIESAWATPEEGKQNQRDEEKPKKIDVGTIMSRSSGSFQQVWGQYGKQLRSWNQVYSQFADLIEKGLKGYQKSS